MQKNGNDRWAELLREWRHETGVTQKEAAEIAGIPYSTYVAYEIGRRNPGAHASGKLAWMVSRRPDGEYDPTMLVRAICKIWKLPEDKKDLVLAYVERLLTNDE